MKKLAIGIVSLVLGTSSLAGAQPQAAPVAPPGDIITRDHRDHRDHDARFDRDRVDGDLSYDGRWSDRFDRFDDNDQAWRRPRWVALGTVGVGRQDLDVNRFGIVRQLRLDLTGNVTLRRVMITYADGHTEVLQVNKTARAMRGQPVMLDLARGRGHAVTGITLFSRGTNTARWGNYGFYGNRGQGTITVSGLRMPRVYRPYAPPAY